MNRNTGRNKSTTSMSPCRNAVLMMVTVLLNRVAGVPTLRPVGQDARDWKAHTLHRAMGAADCTDELDERHGAGYCASRSKYCDQSSFRSNCCATCTGPGTPPALDVATARETQATISSSSDPPRALKKAACTNAIEEQFVLGYCEARKVFCTDKEMLLQMTPKASHDDFVHKDCCETCAAATGAPDMSQLPGKAGLQGGPPLSHDPMRKERTPGNTAAQNNKQQQLQQQQQQEKSQTAEPKGGCIDALDVSYGKGYCYARRAYCTQFDGTSTVPSC
jgi:hypothetical protein